jgi:hypothetical protein
LWLFAIAGLATVAGYLAYVVGYGTNVVYWDEWNLVPLVADSMSGKLTVAQLWAQHNEDRTFFPNLAAIVLARSSHWNDFAFYFFSAALLTATVAIIIWVYRVEVKRSPLWFVFIPLVGFTLAQHENTLWAFQTAWFIVLLSVIGGLAILVSDRVITTPRLLLAGLFGILGSYSSLQGLLIWPIGLVLLFAAGRQAWARICWALAGTFVTIFYFLGFNNSSVGVRSPSAYFHNLGTTASAFFATIGNVIPNAHLIISIPSVQLVVGPSLDVSEFLGTIIAIAGLIVIVAWFREGRPGGAKAFSAALVMVGLGFDVLLIPSRLYDDVAGGQASRYATMLWPLVLGIYLAAVVWRKEGSAWSRRSFGIRVGAVLLVSLQVIFATMSGISAGQGNVAITRTSADVLANYSSAPWWLVSPYLFPPSSTYVDSNAVFLIHNNMNVFEGGTAASLRKLGLVPGGEQLPLLKEPRLIKLWTNDDRTAAQAWTTLSNIFDTSGDYLDAYATGEAHSAGLVEWAAVQPVIPSGDFSPWNAPPSVTFLQLYTRYYLAWVPELSWKPFKTLPIPGKLRPVVSGGGLAALTWQMISGVYANRPDLRAAFTSTNAVRMLDWAAHIGTLPLGDTPELIPLHRELLHLVKLAR